MAKINLGSVEQYKPTGQFEFFQLKNDGDIAEVRFLYETLDDVDIRNVHTLELNSGKKIYVDCLREDYESDMGLCPCCAGQNKANLQVWIPMYDVKEKKVVIWNRGYNFITSVLIPKLQEIADNGSPICATTFLIERHGEAGDKKTWFEVEAEGADDFILEDLGTDFEMPNVVGTILHEKSYEELRNFMRTGFFTSGRGDSGARTRGGNSVAGSDASVSDIIRRRGTRPDTNN